jgi:hypothetical protein
VPVEADKVLEYAKPAQIIPRTPEEKKAEAQRIAQTHLPCPNCGRLTLSLKRYSIFYWIFLFLMGAMTRRITYTACPPCQRRKLALRTVITLVPANFFFPLVLLLHSSLFAASFTSGHSRSIRKELQRLYRTPA